jgi:serine/threonine protein kinase
MTPLALNTLLLHYRIEQVLGIGGFGVTYLARDEQLGKLFAIKEYFPADFAARDKGKTVRAKADSVDNFLWGKERFLEEARVLARFQHPNIVGISRIFDANGTAYIVQEYQSGRSFKEWVSELESPPSQVELDLLVSPILSALEVIHRNDVLHRDIAPDNIYIRDDGSPVLLDFGSAREAVAQRTKTMSAVVKSGYSPPEQYSTKGKSQGAWSDIYALAATLYWAVTGKAPEEATDRILEDDLVPATKAAKGAYRTSFLEAIDHALKLSPSERPRSIEAWRPALLGSLKIDAAIPASQPEAWRLAPLGSLEIDATTPASQRKPEAQSGLQGGPLTAGPQTPARSSWRSPLVALLAIIAACILFIVASLYQMSGSNTATQQRTAEQREAVWWAGNAQVALQHQAEQRAAEQRAADQRAAEQRAAEQRIAEQRAAEQRAAEQRASERAAEQRSAEFRAAQRAAEQRAAEQRAAEQREEEERAAEQKEREAWAHIPNGQVVFDLRNNTRLEIQVVFHASSPGRNGLRWGSETEPYRVRPGTNLRQSLRCKESEVICFGARSDSGQHSWGSGINNNLQCTTCCAVCGSGTHRSSLGNGAERVLRPQSPRSSESFQAPRHPFVVGPIED